MKTHILALFLLLSALSSMVHAQYPVTVIADPVAVQNQVEQIAKWTESIAVLNQQLQQLQQTVQLAQTTQRYIGDPSAAGQALRLQLLGPTQLSQTTGQLTSVINQTVDGAKALQNGGSALFTPVPAKTPGGFTVSFDATSFKPFAAIQNQDANVAKVVEDTTSQIAALQQQKATTLAQIQSASDQSTVQKLTAQTTAIDGQIAALNQQQQAAINQMTAQNIANQNDQEMKAQAARQSADHEQNLSLQNLMQWEGQISSDRKEFK